LGFCIDSRCRPYNTLALPCECVISISLKLCLYVVPFMRIFSVKEWRDLETGGRGRSGSLKMAPFDRSYTTFYWSAIVSIAMCCTISKLFDVE